MVQFTFLLPHPRYHHPEIPWNEKVLRQQCLLLSHRLTIYAVTILVTLSLKISFFLIIPYRNVIIGITIRDGYPFFTYSSVKFVSLI